MSVAAWKGAWRAFSRLAGSVVHQRLGSTRPFKITWSITDRCDCRCQGCLIWKREKRREPTPEEIGSVLAGAPSIRWVNLTGGEIFLRDDVPEVARTIAHALPRLAVLDFPTTGQRTANIVAAVEEIARLGLPRLYVTVSLEGPPELHDRLRGREGAFDRAVRTFGALRRIPEVQTYLGMTLSDANADWVSDALAAVRQRLPDGSTPLTWGDLHLNVYTTSGHYYANVDAPLAPPATLGTLVGRVLRARERSWRVTDRLEATYLRHVETYLSTGRSPIPCRSLSASVFVDTAGDVLPCTVWGRRLGNVREAGLYEILGTDEAAAARETVRRDRCPGCWSPCEAQPTIVASLPGSVLRRASHRR